MRFTGKELLRRVGRQKLLPNIIEVDQIQWVIVKDATYTVETGPNEPDVAQAVLHFLWRVGFSHVAVTKARNWESGVLLDHSDIVHCKGYG